ncbi:DUF1275 family protein [Humisphaera borealis]|uniref:DUF1275 family protein n=1 Tax=Humisphaera borealis TaxID=2807512 RepID=A0A7M2WRX7_9BACT|nr:DUF1275 family protein [Humisphaera borealis]QOV87922.1 DUF1275 family protein [Humisphaera borealis]
MLSAGAYSFRLKSRLAISLSWIAGYTNVIAFIMCGGIVVSHVTGNVTHFGLAVAETGFSVASALQQVAFFGFLVLAFFAGAVASGVMTEGARRRGIASKYMLPMAVEALLLVALAIGIELHYTGFLPASNRSTFYVLSGLASLAMGLQNATITRISGAVIRTTHLTGVVTDLGLESVQYILWAWDRTHRPLRNGRVNGTARPSSRLGRVWRLSSRHASFQRLLLLASIFGSFLFGVIAGSVIFYLFPTRALLAPVSFLLWIIYVDWRKPIADVKELDLTADTEFGGSEGVKAMLPGGVGIYRLTHHRRDAQHHAPDFLAWVDRLPRQWRVVILAVSPLTHFDADSAMNLLAAAQKLRSQHRELILCGVRAVQYKALDRHGLVEELGHDLFTPDIEFAIARAINALEALGGEPAVT